MTRLWEALTSSVRVSPRSSAARSRSSGSVVESWISEVSSVTDFSPDQPPHSIHTERRRKECAYLIGLVPLVQCAHNGAVFAQLLGRFRVKAIGEPFGERLVLEGDVASS